MSNETVDVTITTGTMIITSVQPSQVVVGGKNQITYYGVNLGLVKTAWFQDDPDGTPISMPANSAGGGRQATSQPPTGTVKAGTSGITWLESSNGQKSNTLPIDFITA